MLYQTLLIKIAQFVANNPEDPGSQTVETLAKYSGKEVMAFLSAYDIRQIDNLRRIIPNAFPRPLRVGGLLGSQNIHGAWKVEPMAKRMNLTNRVIL
jgi:hypothetical protein